MADDKELSERRVSVTRRIDAPAATIFAVLADPAKHPLIDGSSTVRANRTPTSQRLGPGSRFSMEMHLVVPYPVTNVVVEFEEGRLLAWRHFGGHRWRWRLDPNEDGSTQVTETFDWSTSIAPRVLERLGFPERNRAGIEATLERLEALVTGSPR